MLAVWFGGPKRRPFSWAGYNGSSVCFSRKRHERTFFLLVHRWECRIGWALAQFPHLVTPNVTIQNAAAPEATLKLLLLALGAGVVVLVPSLLYLLQIFKRQGIAVK